MVIPPKTIEGGDCTFLVQDLRAKGMEIIDRAIEKRFDEARDFIEEPTKKEEGGVHSFVEKTVANARLTQLSGLWTPIGPVIAVYGNPLLYFKSAWKLFFHYLKIKSFT
ncbi:hypothetical protein [Flagellimonas aurea]|uniref:hypothetical protein n=1 Tax=Flagellimonas aurea TaxID=2915619 RepID=UPI0035D0F572